MELSGISVYLATPNVAEIRIQVLKDMEPKAWLLCTGPPHGGKVTDGYKHQREQVPKECIHRNLRIWAFKRSPPELFSFTMMVTRHYSDSEPSSDLMSVV